MHILNKQNSGITAKPRREKTKVITGPNQKNIKFACVGETFSFNINFNASANACKVPQTPVILGPNLLCILPIAFLSATVTKATAIKTGRIINKSKIIENIVGDILIKS